MKNRNKQALVAELRLTRVDTKGRSISTEFVRWRTDKSPNAARTIDSVIGGYLNPIDLRDVLQIGDPKKILKYLTRKQLLRVIHQNDIFTEPVRKSIAGYCKITPNQDSQPQKIVVRFPEKSIPFECIAERDFPKATIKELHTPQGEFIVPVPGLEIPKFKGAKKMWAVSGPKKKITINTQYMYNTPVELYPMSLKPAGSAAVANKGVIEKTIFRVTGYTNIIFEKPQKGNPEYYLETYPGETPKNLIRLIKMFLEL